MRMSSEVAVEMKRHSSATFTPTLQTPTPSTNLLEFPTVPLLHSCKPLLARGTVPSTDIPDVSPCFDSHILSL